MVSERKETSFFQCKLFWEPTYPSRLRCLLLLGAVFSVHMIYTDAKIVSFCCVILLAVHTTWSCKWAESTDLKETAFYWRCLKFCLSQSDVVHSLLSALFVSLYPRPKLCHEKSIVAAVTVKCHVKQQSDVWCLMLQCAFYADDDGRLFFFQPKRGTGWEEAGVTDRGRQGESIW